MQKILKIHSFFFLYANIFPPQFEALFGLSKETLWSVFEAIQ